MLAKVIIENGVKKIQALTADTGTGAPVGSIIVVCSNILPSGYLGLGVQYDITNYPALYQVLGTDTTPTASALGLPTLSSGQYAIKATSGLTENQQENVLNTINENNSYSTEEHPTGKKWIDGKPIYSKTLQLPIANGNNTYPHNIANIEFVTKVWGISKEDNENDFRPIPFSYYGSNNWTCGVYANLTNIAIECGSEFAESHSTSYITIEYTKTN